MKNPITVAMLAMSGSPLSARSLYAGRQGCQGDRGINRSTMLFGARIYAAKAPLQPQSGTDPVYIDATIDQGD